MERKTRVYFRGRAPQKIKSKYKKLIKSFNFNNLSLETSLFSLLPIKNFFCLKVNQFQAFS